MKSIGKILFLLALMCSVGPFVWAQNAQEEIEEMYQQREQQEQLDEALRKAHKESLQKDWENLLGEHAHLFDRESVEKAFSKYVNFQDIYLWKKEKEAKEQSEPTKDKYILKKFSFRDDPQSEEVKEDKYKVECINEPILYIPIIEKIPTGVFDENYKKITWDITYSTQITDGPSLLLKKKEECLLMDAQYNVHELKHCNAYVKYLPVVEERKQVLQELGFSDKTIERYALKNPWNLSVYTACDRFIGDKEAGLDGYELVEKVVVAWRYCNTQNSDIQYRSVLIKSNGKEEERPYQKSHRLPLCLDLKEKERKAFYKNIMQPPIKLDTIRYAEYTSGCNPVFSHWESKTPPKREMKIDENWFF